MQRDDITLNGDERSIESRPVLVICTGGTFDKVYDPILESLIMKGRPASEHILESAQAHNVSLCVVTQKDSLDLTSEDIDAICNAIREAAHRSIVVVHGTSRLVETAKRIPDELSKTIIFTGAMIPASIDPTEASFNLGFALAAAKILPVGVWLAMNGRVFLPDDVVKNTEAGRFERL